MIPSIKYLKIQEDLTTSNDDGLRLQFWMDGRIMQQRKVELQFIYVARFILKPCLIPSLPKNVCN